MGQRALLSTLAIMLTTGCGSAPETPDAGPVYERISELPSGPEIVMVFLSSSGCVANTMDGFHDAVRQSKVALADEVRGDGLSFSAIAHAIEWDLDAGLTYLAEFGTWDEVSAGRNWLNAGSINYYWRDLPGRPTIPTLLLIRRTISISESSIDIEPDSLLLRLRGGGQIIDWVKAGAPYEGYEPT